MITGSRAIELLPTRPTKAMKVVDELHCDGITVPLGYVTDGASIPRLAWRVVGHPFEGQFIRPAMIHDIRCEFKVGTWQATHRQFYDNLLAEGVSQFRAWLMFRAVWHFGPRWVNGISLDTLARITSSPTAPNGRAWGDLLDDRGIAA